jgi:hypothetical protein
VSGLKRFGGQRAAGGQPTAATADQQGVELHLLRRRVLEYLQPGRALPGDDMPIIVGRHDNAAIALCQRVAISSRLSL